jgi:hypothetical protein
VLSPIPPPSDAPISTRELPICRPDTPPPTVCTPPTIKDPSTGRCIDPPITCPADTVLINGVCTIPPPPDQEPPQPDVCEDILNQIAQQGEIITDLEDDLENAKFELQNARGDLDLEKKKAEEEQDKMKIADLESEIANLETQIANLEIRIFSANEILETLKQNAISSNCKGK